MFPRNLNKAQEKLFGDDELFFHGAELFVADERIKSRINFRSAQVKFLPSLSLSSSM